MIGNIIIVLSAIFIFLFISQGNLAKDELEHLGNNGVLICKDANSSFTISLDDVMETTDRFEIHIKPYGQKISYSSCEKKITKTTAKTSQPNDI